ncbi:MAG: hypothetical protein IKF52_02830 [Clostridia bacterium]|nr:hypothetical protein [Clostridia bacterium]
MKKNSGITLVALIITIIVLLILAGVTIAMVVGDNGILNRTNEAKNEQKIAEAKEEISMTILDIQAEYYNEEDVNKLDILLKLDPNDNNHNLLESKLYDKDNDVDVYRDDSEEKVFVKYKEYIFEIDSEFNVQRTIEEANNDGSTGHFSKTEGKEINIFNYGTVGDGFTLSTEHSWGSKGIVNINEDNYEMIATGGRYAIVHFDNIDFVKYEKICFVTDNEIKIKRAFAAENPANVNYENYYTSTANQTITSLEGGLYLCEINIARENRVGSVAIGSYDGNGDQKIYRIYLVERTKYSIPNYKDTEEIFNIYTGGKIGTGIEMITTNTYNPNGIALQNSNNYEIFSDYGYAQLTTNEEIDFSQYEKISVIVDNINYLDRICIGSNFQNVNSASIYKAFNSGADVTQLENGLYLLELDISSETRTGGFVMSTFYRQGDRRVYRIFLTKNSG